MKIDKHTLALIGYPIEHSRSPIFHNEAIKLLNLDYHYQAISIDPALFPKVFPSLLSQDIAGLNITMPYKKAVSPYLDHISQLSKLTNSINTIYRKNNEYYGTTTDGTGFFKSLFYKMPTFIPEYITILGSGAAARSILAAATQYSIQHISIFQRKGEHYDDCLAFIEQLKLYTNSLLQIELFYWDNQISLNTSIKNSTLLINCTNIGLCDSSSPLVNDAFLHSKLHVYDIIYKDQETTLIKQARKAGCSFQNGLGMLLFQGAESFHLFTGQTMPIEKLTTLNLKQI